ncbi:MAG: methylmalonyl Co-A mutase-associated GTPase MeaB [Tissierellia bacterium]|nr:methylmalonyl Co-A mutase-associated GTPase MeaB [Tissierellia bacterium]
MELWERVIQGDEVACARAISLVEDEREGYIELLKNLQPHTGSAVVLGFTGPPGAGKSTLVDKVAKSLRKKDKKVGIIAIDPTSPFTRGAILGDRIRMSDLNLDPGVFIRSMGTRGSLGGISKATQAGIKVLDAYGCEYILIETVGVGQSEIDIVNTADTVVMVMVPGLGDDIQAIKAGIMEIGDVFVVNKADNDRARKTRIEIEMMLDFNKNWEFRPPVSMAIASEGEGIEELVDNIFKHQDYLERSGKKEQRRFHRERIQVEQYVMTDLRDLVDEEIEKYEEKIRASVHGGSDPYTIGESIYSTIVRDEQ